MIQNFLINKKVSWSIEHKNKDLFKYYALNLHFSNHRLWVALSCVLRTVFENVLHHINTPIITQSTTLLPAIKNDLELAAFQMCRGEASMNRVKTHKLALGWLRLVRKIKMLTKLL